MSLFHTIARPAPEAVSTLDFSYLARLQQGVRQNNVGQSKFEAQVAQQFEALFIQQILKQGRKSLGLGGVFDSAQTRLAQEMADEQMATHLATPGMGLAQALLAQMRFGRSDSAAAAEQGPLQEKRMDDWAALRLPHLDLGRMQASFAGLSEGEQELVAASISELLSLLEQGTQAQATVRTTKQAPPHIQQFIERMADAAGYAAEETGLPSQLILSQAALESGWGRREIKLDDGTTSHNLFGIKASRGWKGKTVDILTTEYQDGVARKVVQPFRAYDSYAESFADYARLISQNKRYREVLDAPNPEIAAKRIQAAGYATDPSYADKLIAIMAYFKPR